MSAPVSGAPLPRVVSAPRCVWPLAAKLGEGACWSVREQALYFVDILGKALHRYRPDGGECRSWRFDEEVSALAERKHAPGLLLSLRHDLALFDPDSRELVRLHRPEPQRTGNRFNDGKCDAHGRFWVGSTDYACRAWTGALYRYEGGSRCARLLDQVCIANGPTWSLDGRTMYFNETGHARTWAIDFDPERGILGERRLWRQFDTPGEGVPDGMTTDATGRLWIARWGGGAVTCHDGEGTELARIELPATNVTSCAFGGPDLRTLYITTATIDLDDAQRAAQPLAGGLFAVELDVSGMPANRFAG